MAATEDRETLGRARLSFADEADIDEFVTMLESLRERRVGPDEWRAFRLLRGTYGQRQTGDAQMLRIKIPQGILDAARSCDAVADVAERYSRGFGHITTRQNIQLHFVKLHDVEPAMRQLAEAGLTTREACGNSVRNITGLPVRRRRRRRAVRRDAVRRGADALPAAAIRSAPRCRASSRSPSRAAPHDHIDAAINDIGWLRAGRHVDGARGAASGSPSPAARRR